MKVKLVSTDDWTIIILRVHSYRAKAESITETRMHSSRMRTVRCSSRLLGRGGVLPRGVSARHRVCPGVYTSRPWTDRHLWKHNLSATTVTDGKNGNKNHFHSVWVDINSFAKRNVNTSIAFHNLFLPAATKLWPRLCFYSCLSFC